MSKEEMIQETAEILEGLFYEDVEFFHGFITRYAMRKGIKKAAPDATNIQSGKVDGV